MDARQVVRARARGRRLVVLLFYVRYNTKGCYVDASFAVAVLLPAEIF